jgi:hypothetical protein
MAVTMLGLVLIDWVQKALDGSAEHAAAGANVKKSHAIDGGSMKMFGSLVLLEETLQHVWTEEVPACLPACLHIPLLKITFHAGHHVSRTDGQQRLCL